MDNSSDNASDEMSSPVQDSELTQTQESNADPTFEIKGSPADLSDSDLLKAIGFNSNESDNGVETKPDENDADDSIEKTDDHDEINQGDDDGDDSDDTVEAADEPDDDDLELPKLDPELAKNPVLLKRAQEFERGFKKQLTRLNAKIDKVVPYEAVIDQLENPATAKDGFVMIAKQLATVYGFDPIEVLGGAKTLPSEDSSGQLFPDEIADQLLEPDKQALSYLHTKLLSDVKAEFEKTFGADLALVAELKKERAQEQAKREFESYVDSVAPNVIRKLEKRHFGWKVTKEQVAKALLELPQYKDKPDDAVEMIFREDLRKHHSKLQKANSRRGPEGITPSTKQGVTMPKNAGELADLSGEELTRLIQ